MFEGRLRSWWMCYHGILVTLAALAFAAFFPHDRYALVSSGTVLVPAFLAVVYSSFSAGRRVGLVSAGLLTAFAAWQVAAPGQAFGYGEAELASLVTQALAAFSAAILVGFLRERSDSATAELVAQRTRTAAAEATRETMLHIFDEVGEAVVLADEHGSIRLWNPAAEKMFGYTVEEALGMNVRELVLADLNHRMRTTGHAPLEGSNAVMELPAVRKDGSHLVVELTLSRMDAPGQVMAIIRDVTERVRLTRELARSNRGLAKANDEMEAFTYLVSHDLKEPVRGVSVMLDALIEDHAHELPPEGARLLRTAAESNDRLSRLLRGLLELSRATRFEVSEIRRVDIHDLLGTEGCMVRIGTLVKEREAKLDVARDIPPISAHPAAMCQVLGNLISNSIKHNPQPVPAVRVYAADQDEEAGTVELIVEDDGPGFPPTALARFASGRLSPITGGRDVGGFGLLIARNVVERQGGRMWLTNMPQGGAQVHVAMPSASG